MSIRKFMNIVSESANTSKRRLNEKDELEGIFDDGEVGGGGGGGDIGGGGYGGGTRSYEVSDYTKGAKQDPYEHNARINNHPSYQQLCNVQDQMMDLESGDPRYSQLWDAENNLALEMANDLGISAFDIKTYAFYTYRSARQYGSDPDSSLQVYDERDSGWSWFRKHVMGQDLDNASQSLERQKQLNRERYPNNRELDAGVTSQAEIGQQLKGDPTFKKIADLQKQAQRVFAKKGQNPSPEWHALNDEFMSLAGELGAKHGYSATDVAGATSYVRFGPR